MGNSPDAPRRAIEDPTRLPCFIFLGEDRECARDEIAGARYRTGRRGRRRVP